jgi:ketosteroid isomerase-like protein
MAYNARGISEGESKMGNVRRILSKGTAAAMDPRGVAQSYLEAFGQKDYDRLKQLLHPDVEFKGPGGSLHNAKDLVAAIRKLSPMLLRTDVKRVFTDRDEAFVRYDFVTNTSVGPVSTVELLKVQDGLIRSIWLLFDQQAWSAVIKEKGRRTETANG